MLPKSHLVDRKEQHYVIETSKTPKTPPTCPRLENIANLEKRKFLQFNTGFKAVGANPNMHATGQPLQHACHFAWNAETAELLH
jgi:hypothetical protein